MAPIGEAYFPPLDRCLSGAQQLWSWELCFKALSKVDRSEHDSLKKFLSDPSTQYLLRQPLSPYSAPNTQTKSTFETKTSAINVSQGSHANYDIQAIKEDALWLSKGTSIDEVSSLRITILEWQTRAATDLLQAELGYDASNGNPLSQNAISLATSQAVRSQSARQHGRYGAQETDIPRRRRLTEILLSERRHLMKCAEYILSRFLCAPTENSDDVGFQELEWLTEISSLMLSHWVPKTALKGKQANQQRTFIVHAIEGLRSRLESLAVGSGWSGLESEQNQVEVSWGRSQAIEIVHILELIRDIQQIHSFPVPAEEILPWFRLMSESGFLEGFQLPYPGFETAYNLPIQSLTSLISLCFLNVTATLDLLAQPSTSSASTPSSEASMPYIFNQAATNELNDIIISVAPVNTASPCVMAWSIITQNVREMALTTRDTRETRQSIRAADKFGAGDSSDTEGYERPVTRGMSALRRRSSTSSDTSQQSTLIEDIYDSISVTALDDDPIAYLANNAAEGGKVFEVVAAIATRYCTPYAFEHNGILDQKLRLCLLDLIRACVEYVEYQPALIVATMAVMTGSERYWDLVDKPSLLPMTGPAALLRQDEVLKRRIFLVALTRYPYESMPLLQLCRALAYQDDGNKQGNEIWLSLQELDMFTCILPSDYQGYENIREDEELDFVQLTEDYTYDLSTPHGYITNGNLLTSGNGEPYLPSRSGIRIPRGTQGQVMSNGKPLVVAWNLEYSGLSYIGQILQCATTTQLTNEYPNSPITSDIVSEAIAFMSVLLLSAVKRNATRKDPAAVQESAASILGQASDNLDRNDDIISVIFQIFENELYKSRRGGEDSETLDVLVECVRFTHALLPIMPDRVWPFLGRSGLLAIGEDGGRLNAIISSYELPSGRYNFLFGCIRLYAALVEDVLQNAIARKTPSKAVSRFGAANALGAGVSRSTMEKVLANLQRTMMDVFDSFGNWKFVNSDERAEIGAWLCATFAKLIDYSYGTDTDSSSKLTSSLLPAARIVLDVFLSQDKTEFTLEPLLRICTDGINEFSTSIPTRGERYHMNGTAAALQLISTLIEASVFLDKDSSHLQGHLFQHITRFTRLYAAEPVYQLLVVNILDSLVRSSSTTEQQPPSLLANLGEHTASRFLQMLSILDKPVDNGPLNVAIWRLLGSILGTRQQWFAHFILTGQTPSHKGKEASYFTTKQKADPMFALALDSLGNIKHLDPSRTLAMLEFVSAAADFWPHMLKAVNDHRTFIVKVSEYASSLNLNSGRKTPASSRDFYEPHVFSCIAGILAMYAHWTQQEGNPKFAEEVLRHLDHLASNVVITPSYNTSLHSNLRQNFAARFPACNLSDFHRTSLKPTSMGESFFYDLGVATKMLSFEPAWHGRKGTGFAEEMRRANLNLSMVDAQVSLFQSWKSLLFELSTPLLKAAKYQKIIAQTVVECLQANAENNLPEHFFERLARSRADLAFTLLETLNVAKSSEPEVQGILPVAWNTLRSDNDDLGAALGADGADYYRLLIRVLYLAIQLHTSTAETATDGNSTNAPPTALKSTVADAAVRNALDIIATLVSRGFRSLTALLHESPKLVVPSDFSILTALLNTCLQIPGLSRNTEHLMSAFTDTQTPRCAAALLSWSDQLAATTSGDPIYGEVAMLFLLELSTVPVLAENLAVEAVLSYILATNLMRLLQDRAFGPLDNPPRMYSIWARGLLPFLLNLLHAVGPPIAAEVAAALNTFPEQLSRASQAFGITSLRSTSSLKKDFITLSVAQEAHRLALIVSILRTFRDAGASAGITPAEVEDIKWDAAQVKDDIEGWLERKGALRDEIVPTSEKEEGWSRMKPVKEGMGDNRLEEKVVEELRGVIGVLGVRDG